MLVRALPAPQESSKGGWSFHGKEELRGSIEEKGLGMKVLSLPVSFCSIWKAGVLMNWLKTHPPQKSNEVPTKQGDISL